MKWQDVLDLLGPRTILESPMLLAGRESPPEIWRQLGRWVRAGQLRKLRRGLYLVAEPWAKERPHAFAVAARLHRPSYVSLESSLSHHGVIPEAVPAVISVTTRRPCVYETPVGRFVYRHVHRSLFWGYEGEEFFVARPEKGLLDLFHLTPGPVRPPFLQELRLDPSTLDLDRLQHLAARTGKPKLVRAASLVTRMMREERESPPEKVANKAAAVRKEQKQ